MRKLYTIAIKLMIFGMKIGAVFNYKLKKGLAGRRAACEEVQKAISKNDRVIWMHAASLGEYEQGLPVLEQLKRHYPNHKILITFFSPSGYENVISRKHIADAIAYLPFDVEKWVKEFSGNFQTDIFFTVKYDYWYHLLQHLKAQGAKIYVVSALFYETQIFFSAYGKWFVRQLSENVDWFFHQTMHSTALAKSLGLAKSSTSGDTRYDRVKNQHASDNYVPYIKEFCQEKTTVVFGSSWEDEERIAEILCSGNKTAKIILAPHDMKRVPHLKKIFPSALLYSELKEIAEKHYEDCGEDPSKELPAHVIAPTQVLIVDCIGLLSKLYSYGDIAVVGGGFHSAGLHNILEAATFGIPVLFGNKYKEKPEADALIAAGGAKSFEDEFFAGNYLLNLMTQPQIFMQMGTKAKDFISSQPDATTTIVKKIVADTKVHITL